MSIKDNAVSRAVDGQPSYVELAYIGTGTTAPAAVTVVMDADADAGDSTITVKALSADIPRGVVIEFTNTNNDVFQVVTTKDAKESDTTLDIEPVDGAEGSGLQFSLTEDDTGKWNGLWRDLRSQNVSFANNENINKIGDVIHGPKGTAPITQQTIVQSIAPTLNRDGQFFTESQIVKDLLKYGKGTGNFWFNLVIPDADGKPWARREGYGPITGVTPGQSADGMIDLPYVVNSQVPADPIFYDEE